MERPTLQGLAAFLILVVVFLAFGPRVGWRVTGVISLFLSVRWLREGRVGVGIEGYPPSFYLTGKSAVAMSLLGIILSLLLILYPEAISRQE